MTLTIVVFGCGQGDPDSDEGPLRVATSLQELAAAFESLMPHVLQEHGIPGIALAVIDNGRLVWSQGYGVADKETNTPVTPRTVFQVASVSKPVAAWGVLHLVEGGLIGLDTPVEDYLTRWHLPPSQFDSDGVTARRLLSHRAGLSLHGYPGFEPGQSLPTIEESLSGTTNGVGGVYLEREPGPVFEYSGGAFTVLQLLIEEVSGDSFVEYMQREVLDPLEMSDSSFEWADQLRARTATAYDIGGEELPNYLFTAKAAAGLYTTADDLAKFVAASMTGPEGEPAGRSLLGPESVRLMHTPVGGVTYGLGHITEGQGDVQRVGHSGANRGWRSFFVAIPDEGIGFVILSNGDGAAPITAWDTRLLCAWADWTGSEAFHECR